MRRYCLHALAICSLSGLSGCGLGVNFPDLWPFNDDPVPSRNTAQVAAPLAAPLPAVSDASRTAVAAAEVPEPVPYEVTPSVEPKQLVAQLTPGLGDPGGSTQSVPGAVNYIISPPDGAVLTNPVRVLFGLDRMGVAPITSVQEGTGHHHLLIDTDLPPLDRPLPASENLRHFSGGQTETTLNLAPGEHTLQLVLGDHSHTPHQPPVVSRQITITVQ